MKGVTSAHINPDMRHPIYYKDKIGQMSLRLHMQIIAQFINIIQFTQALPNAYSNTQTMISHSFNVT